MSALGNLLLAVDQAPAAEGLWAWLQHEAPRLFTQLDGFLLDLTRAFGAWTYVVLFAIVFCETGLVVTPFLPGDSLLFAAGMVCASESDTLDVRWMAALLFTAALLGDNLNYGLGRFIGPRAFSGRVPLLNPSHLAKTRDFFDRHGGKSVVLARFVPIVRTFAPFVAGVGAMRYPRFLAFSLLGAALWVGLLLTAGWGLGTLPWVKANFSKVILAIILVSLMPIAIEWWKHRRASRMATEAGR
jgi:membrane-associated protein